jgi:hypothetical protein
MVKSIQKALLENFEMNDLGEARQYFGAKYEYYLSCIFVH